MRWMIFGIVAVFLLVGSATQAQGWNVIMPEGDTLCARGTPYAFFNRPANPDKLLIYFQGGGACWNAETCAPGAGLFDDTVDPAEAGNYVSGIFNQQDGSNPLADYSVVVIPYCTGDWHMGARTVAYEDTGEIHHNGYANATAALNWTYANYPRVSEVVISGCSAGAYGSIYHAPSILRRYQGARAAQVGDAAVGLAGSIWGGFGVWGAGDHAGIRATPDNFVNALYERAARAYPRAHFAQYTTVTDNQQIRYYQLMNPPISFTQGMDASLERLRRLSNFRAYIAPGGEHCITPSDRFYGEQVGDVRFRDWFASWVSGGDAPNVRCVEC